MDTPGKSRERDAKIDGEAIYFPQVLEGGFLMKEQLEHRLEDLKKEFEIGQTRLQAMERQQMLLRETLLRISGAIQVLEEMLMSDKSQPGEHMVTGSNPVDGVTPQTRSTGYSSGL
jgi:hypothetical protein